MSSIFALTSGGGFAPNITLPDDGDLADAASINGAVQAVGDNTKYLYDSRGAYKLALLYQTSHDDDTAVGVNTTFTSLGAFSNAPAAQGAAQAVLAGDVIDVVWSGGIYLTAGAAGFFRGGYRLEYTENGGANSTLFGAASLLAGSPTQSTTFEMDAPCTLIGRRLVNTSGPWQLKINGGVLVTAGGIPQAGTRGSWSVTMRVWRAY